MTTIMLLLEITDLVSHIKKKKILTSLDTHVTDNNNYHLNWAYTQAMTLYPQYHYTGKMYRMLSVKNSENMTPSQLLRVIRDYPKDVYSFTTDIDFAYSGNEDETYSKQFGNTVIIQQVTTGLNVIALLTNEFPTVFGEEYYNEFPEQQEVLAFLDKNTLTIIKQ